jgi:hypothetical protein
LSGKRRPSAKKTAINRFETEAGVQGQTDWSPYKIQFTEERKKEGYPMFFLYFRVFEKTLYRLYV